MDTEEEEEGDAADDAEGQEGVEGLDWRYGSVEELDPSEWQVGCGRQIGRLMAAPSAGLVFTHCTNAWNTGALECYCQSLGCRGLQHAADIRQHTSHSLRRRRPPHRTTPPPPLPLLCPPVPQVPPHCIPIHANVTTYDWAQLVRSTQFDVIMMDPPWQLATANPTRGVALGYSQASRAAAACGAWAWTRPLAAAWRCRACR